MTIERQITSLAGEFAAHARDRELGLQHELEQIEKRKADIQTQIRASNLAHRRLSDFKIQLGADYQCPRCWIEDSARSSLMRIAGESWRKDYFKCQTCDLEIELADLGP